MAAVCLSVCGVTFLFLTDGQFAAAAAACLLTSRSTASRESRPPGRVGNRGAAGAGARWPHAGLWGVRVVAGRGGREAFRGPARGLASRPAPRRRARRGGARELASPPWPAQAG